MASISSSGTVSRWSVAGDTEDKPEVAARVGWSGAGINLRTGSPTPDAIGAAVRRIRDEPAFAMAAGRIGAAIGRARPLETIMAEIGGQIEQRPGRHGVRT